MEQSLHPFSSYTLPWFQLLLLCSYIVLADIAIQTHILSFILIIIRCQSAQSYRKCADKSKGYQLGVVVTLPHALVYQSHSKVNVDPVSQAVNCFQ